MNSRRKLLVAFGAGALTAPFGSFAQQQGKVWRVGFLAQRSRPTSLGSWYYGEFSRGMRDLGYIEGKNLVIEWRFSAGNYERLPGLAAELVKLKVDVIVTTGTPSTTAAQQATTNIPIVMASGGDPVGARFVKSLARPEGNITGLTTMSGDLVQKQLEMLRSVVPKLSRAAVLMNPANSTDTRLLRNVHAAGAATKVTILPVEARTVHEIEKAFAAMDHRRAEAVIVSFDSIFNEQYRHISALASEHRLPSIAGRKEYAEAGGLMGYGPNFSDQYRRAAAYIDKIFKGAKAGDLPVEQPTKFELIINGKTAKTLGLEIPQSLLISADKVIE